MVKIFQKKINTIQKIMIRIKNMRSNRMRGKKKNIFENVSGNKLRDLPDIFKIDFKVAETRLFEFESSFLYFNMILLFLIIVLFIYYIIS